MKNLIRFELRKILLNRLAIISLAAVFLLSLGLFFSTLQGMHAFDGKSAEGTGRTAVAIDKKIASEYEGILTDEKVQQMMSEFKDYSRFAWFECKIYLYKCLTVSGFFSFF